MLYLNRFKPITDSLKWRFAFNKVFITKGDNGYELSKEVLQKLHLNIKELKTKKILIKPNAGRLVEKNTGINTNPDVVAGVIDFLLEHGIKNLQIGESPILGVKALESLARCGITEIADKRNIPCIDLDADPPRDVDIPEGVVIDRLKVCRKVLDADYIISIPVMKTHMHTQVSLGLKNMKGCLYEREKVRLHQLPFSDKIPAPAKPLDMAIADMASILMPDLVVIDGTIGLEGLGPSAGDAKAFGIVLASTNCLAADWVAAKLMGLNPLKVQHLKLAINHLKKKDIQFAISHKSLKIDPADYLKWKSVFKKPPKKISLKYANVTVDDKDSCSACLSTVLMFLKRYYHEFADYFTVDKPLHIALGKAIGKQPKNTLLIGNCTFKQKAGCVFVKGCPPVASQIRKELDKLLCK